MSPGTVSLFLETEVVRLSERRFADLCKLPPSGVNKRLESRRIVRMQVVRAIEETCKLAQNVPESRCIPTEVRMMMTWAGR